MASHYMEWPPKKPAQLPGIDPGPTNRPGPHAEGLGGSHVLFQTKQNKSKVDKTLFCTKLYKQRLP